MTTSEERKWVRFDDDQWDIITSVGYTALVVAAWRALHTASPRPMARDDYAKDFITASADPSLNKMLADGPGTSDDATVFPRLYGAQTRFFDDFFRSANDAGVRQAVILATGLDSRTYRLQWATDTTVFEVDQPKILEFKARVLADQGAAPTARRKDVVADLRHDWSVPLKSAGFDPEKPTAWSVEGLLPYLTGAAQDALFSRIHQLSASRSHLAVGALGSHFDPDRLGAIQTAHPEFTTSGGVDFSALTYSDDGKATPAQWLAEHRWSVHDVGTTLDLQARCGRTAPDIDAAVDQVLHSGYLTAIR